MNWATQTMTTTSHGSPAPVARSPVAADLTPLDDDVNTAHNRIREYTGVASM
jgi:hypothetical protein